MLWLLAHALHLGLVVFGLIGVAMLLLPQLQEARSRRTSYRPPANPTEHEERIAALRAAVQEGRLTSPTEAAKASSAMSGARDSSNWRAVAVVSSVAAAGVHAAVFPHHLEEAVLVGVFFLAITLAQAAWACLVCLDATRDRLVAGIVGNLGLIVLWGISRTLGLPVLGREAVGGWDLAAGAWELIIVVACLVGLGRQTRATSTGAGRPEADGLGVGGALRSHPPRAERHRLPTLTDTKEYCCVVDAGSGVQCRDLDCLLHDLVRDRASTGVEPAAPDERPGCGDRGDLPDLRGAPRRPRRTHADAVRRGRPRQGHGDARGVGPRARDLGPRRRCRRGLLLDPAGWVRGGQRRAPSCSRTRSSGSNALSSSTTRCCRAWWSRGWLSTWASASAGWRRSTPASPPRAT